MTQQADANKKWHEELSTYPTAEELAAAIQDPGVHKTLKKKKKEVKEWKFPAIERFCGKIFNNINRVFEPEGFTKNFSRGKAPLYKEFCFARKHVDVNEAHPMYHKYGKDGKVHILSNTPNLFGMDGCVERFHEQHELQLRQKSAARTPNDGLRLGCILLDPQYRDTVAGIMSKKKDRKKSDVAGDPAVHFFEKILDECFSNPEYFATTPSEDYYSQFPEDEKSKWDPNDAAIFESTRDASWLKSTWDEHIRPKYKRALDKWNKETGGGDGSPQSFIDYCAGDRWLVWIFCKDLETNFLLACSAAGRMPHHLQAEAGFDDVDTSDISGSLSAREVEVIENKKRRARVDNMMDQVATLMANKPENKTDFYLSKVREYTASIRDDDALNDMSPDSKEVYLTTLKRRRKEMIAKMKEDGDKDRDNNNN